MDRSYTALGALIALALMLGFLVGPAITMVIAGTVAMAAGLTLAIGYGFGGSGSGISGMVLAAIGAGIAGVGGAIVLVSAELRRVAALLEWLGRGRDRGEPPKA